MRKVTIVVPVLITSCQVSLKPKTGPVAAQITTMATAVANVAGFPDAFATAIAMRVKKLWSLLSLAMDTSPDFTSPVRPNGHNVRRVFRRP